jgi:hypothetical protein
LDWFGFLFLAAFVVSLVVGKAYFRGVVNRATAPRRYWSIVACYFVLGTATGLIPLIKRAPANSPLASIRDIFTDAATRAAYDIEAGVARSRNAPSDHYSIELIMRSHPEGCEQDYTLQLSARSALLVWCKDAGTGQVSSSHSTTYHLRFVDVPQTLIVNKHRGEIVTLEMQKVSGGKDLVLGMH